ncbi:uncharacterized protein LOC119078579 [Bradysia coprophila]|uniref:uncharacterized protein LOC119078579 n=1 Tax=Bradysia coprophila TaxID=38358 RepID=UPI00187D87B9|nr:uncharacterized protein LOC119078579 [Bradysia coprophila]
MRSAVVITAVLFALQINGAFGIAQLLAPVLDPVLKLLPIDVTRALPGIAQLLGKCDCGGTSPEFEQEVAAYNVYKNFTRENNAYDYCCRADQFPHISKAVACFAFCLQNNVALKVGQPLCKLLTAISPLTCDVEKNPCSTGCKLQSSLSPLLGPVGSFLGYTIVKVLDPLNALDGCLIPGAAQFYSQAINNQQDRRNYGNAVDPVGAVGGIALGGLFAIFRCLGGPISHMSLSAWEAGSQKIVDNCLNNKEAKYWKQPALKTDQC